MSQYSFKALKDSCDVNVLVGYDEPLKYHFLVVVDDHEGHTLFSNLELKDPAMTLEEIHQHLHSWGMVMPAVTRQYLESDQLMRMLQRETDDATARPVWLAVRTPYSGQDYPPYKEWTVEQMREMEDDDVSPQKVIEAQQSGEHSSSTRSDFHLMDIAGVFWTVEDARAYCDRNKHNGRYFTWGLQAHGVLAQIMDFTCKREIERRHVREGWNPGPVPGQ